MIPDVLEIEGATAAILEEAEKKIEEHTRWSGAEWARRTAIEDFMNAKRRYLNQALLYKLRTSPLGCFLRGLNKAQEASEEVNRAKLDILDGDARDWPPHLRSAEIHDDGILEQTKARMRGLIEEAIMDAGPGGIIPQHKMLGLMKTLRLQHCHITKMDSSISDLDNLEALILSGNYLSDFHGRRLPRNVKFLELYGNFVRRIVRLKKGLPENLLYLGLGDNYLTNRSKIEDLCRLRHLCFLNLGDNNIEDLSELLKSLQQITTLRSLVLQGNPCSVMISYKNIVQNHLPRLVTLDSIEVARPEVQVDVPDKGWTAVLQVFGFKMMGVPKPKSVKTKNAQTGYQLELECPLLDENLKRYEVTEIVNRLKGIEPIPERPPSPKNKKGRKGKSRGDGSEKPTKEGTKSGKGTAKSRKGTAKSGKSSAKKGELRRIKAEYAKFLADDREIAGAIGFKSKRVQWAEVIRFKEPAIEIPVPNQRLYQLRDALRSLLTLRLVYTVTLPPEKKKKETKEKVKSKTKDSEKGSKLKPEETVLLRQIVAKIPIPSQVIGWSETSLEYTWDIRKPYFAVSFPGLKNIKFSAEKKMKKVKETKKNKSKEGTPAKDLGPYPIPKLLTCHVGIGLKRDKQIRKDKGKVKKSKK